MKEFKEFEEVKICDLCGSTENSDLYAPSHIRTCDRCGFVFASPRPTFNEIQNAYSVDGFYDGWLLGIEGRKKLWKKRYDRTKEFLNPKSKILDYSAGIGTFLQYARLGGQEVYGTEISTSAKTIAQQTYGIELYDEPILLANGYKDYYDAITAWHVVEHVGSPRGLLEKFHQCLKERGVLIIAVPNNYHRPLKSLFFLKKQNPDLLYPKLVPGAEIHLSYFNMNTLRFLLEKSRFNVEYAGIDDHFANPNWKTALKYFIYVLIMKIFKSNYSETIFIVARKTK